MFGKSIMQAMTKEDVLQLSNAGKFLVPLGSYRNQLKSKPDLNKIDKFPENSHLY